MIHPIIFSAPMVRALLEGRKSQTRRVLKPAPSVLNGGLPLNDGRGSYACEGGWKRLPYASGDRLWVREAHALVPPSAYRMSDGVEQRVNPDAAEREAAVYREGWERSLPGRWRPSIHMPRWASRLTLTVTAVRVQRLQEISLTDLEAEGIVAGPPTSVDEAHDRWVSLWDSLHGAGAWDGNPWVVALTFTVEHRNIDASEAAHA